MGVLLKKSTLRNIGIVFVVIAILFLTKGFGLFNAGEISGSAISNSETNIEGEVRIPLFEITREAKWMDYNANGIIIKYFVVKADDESIKTAFDACDVCYKAKKGYRQEGSYMKCNNCGKTFLINNLGTENKNPGGCWPGYLPSSVEGDELVIKKVDLEKGKWRFT